MFEKVVDESPRRYAQPVYEHRGKLTVVVHRRHCNLIAPTRPRSPGYNDGALDTFPTPAKGQRPVVGP